MPAVISCRFRPDGTIVRTSETDRAIFPAGAVVFDIVVPADRERLLAAVARKGGDRSLELRCKDQTGRLRVFEAEVVPCAEDEFQLSARDVTELCRTQDIAQAQRAVLDQIATGTPLVGALDAIARLVERGAGDAVVAVYLRRGDSLDLAAAPSAPSVFTTAAATVRATDVAPAPGTIEPLSGALAALAADSGLAFGWWCAVADDDGTDRARIVVLATTKRFLSEDERTRCDEAAALIAITLGAASAARRADDADALDVLTAVLNRTALIRALEPGPVSRELAFAADLVAISVRIDGVADANHRLGLHAGDAVLVAVAERLRRVVRGRDLVARWSGTRFVVVGRNRGGSSALAAFVARIDEGLAAPVLVGGEAVEALPKIDALPREPGETITALLGRLDAARRGASRTAAADRIGGSGSGTDGR